jgi:hypothetical protein
LEYKIFGPGQQLPDNFKEDLEALFHLDDQQRDAIADWFLSARSYELYGPKLPSIVAASTLLPEQFRQAAGITWRLLYTWQHNGLELQDIERDLLLLGFDPEKLRILSNFLSRLSSVKERVWLDGLEGAENVTGLPTIDDVNIVWDARPLFGSAPYDYYAVDGDDRYTKFLGLTYLATLEVIASDNYGQKQRTAIQLCEQGFRRLLLGMKRAGEQLDILKERTKMVASDANVPREG